jgi:uncharacterized FAD-dependent dehydrogenase
LGVRIETTSEILAPLTDLTPDPRLSMETHSGVFRTYAFATGGTVAIANDIGTPRVTVRPQPGGRSGRTSFSLLWQPTDMGALDLGLKPLGVERLGQIRPAFVSYQDQTKLELPSTMPQGDVGTHWPEAYWQGFDDFLSKLDTLAPGVSGSCTLVYSPAIERQWRFVVNQFGETDVPGLFLAGDGAAISQGAMAAAISGVVAGRGILRSLNNQP